MSNDKNMQSISDVDSYKKVCLDAAINDSIFNNFKNISSYNEILEHVSKEQGQLYLEYINSNFTDMDQFIESFKKNDIYGGTLLSNYDKIGDISPSTLRYIKVLSDLKNLFNNLENMKVVEIGVGYGGQCFILNQYYKIKEYSLIDLNESLLLTNKYLQKLDVSNHRIINIDNISDLDEDFDLVISNYAYSELSRELQDLYYEKIIKRSKNGYFTYNFISELFNIDSYSKEEVFNKFSDKNLKVMNEYPNTFENNMILYF
jgi:putative sugar O-methyltransferase